MACLPGLLLFAIAAAAEERPIEIQRFVLYAYRNIIADVAVGEGEYLDALLALCEASGPARAGAVISLRQALVTEQEKFGFARRVADRYLHHADCNLQEVQ